MSPAKVSVVMPAYNGGNYLAQSVECVLAQTYPHWELVIVDNHSSDATGEIARSYACKDQRIRVVTNPATVSVIENHNIAAAQMASDARWCKVLHVDDSMQPDTLGLMTELGERHEQVGVISAWTTMGDKVLGRVEPFEQCVFKGRDITRRTLLGEIYPFQSPSCLLIRADLIRNRPSFYIGEDLNADVDAAYSLLETADFGVVQKVLINVGRPDESVTTSVVLPLNKLLASNLELLQKFGPRVLSASELDKRIAERMKRYRDFLARCVLEGRDAEFWAFHTDALQRLGFPLTRTSLLWHVAKWIAERPRRLIHYTSKRFKKS